MRQLIFLLFLILTIQSCVQKEESVQLLSPDKNFKFVLSAAQELSYAVSFSDSIIIEDSKLGFRFLGDTVNNPSYSIDHIEQKSILNSWEPVYGERREIPDNYNEALIKLIANEISKPNFNIRVRAYNEGVAFRYEFDDVDNKVVIEEELTEFSFPVDSKAWISKRAQSEIYDIPAEQIDIEAERPMLIEQPNKIFLSLGEAGLVDFARMKFQLKEASILKSSLSSEVIFDKPFNSPWRYMMAADAPGKLLEHNYLLLNLNEPNEIADYSWIKPGKVIREVTLTTQGGMACVNFAEKHNLQYVEFDAGWYGNEYDTLSDATTISLDPKRSKGPLDLHKVIAFAKSKGIGIILYVNIRALEKQLDEILPLYQSWGIAGVKYGFVRVGSQKWTSWLHEAVRKAADHKLMVDIHDEYRPTGYSRTYPNLMTQEGIRGDEESPDNAMVLNTLFTRMLAGAGDHTNCYMASRVDAKMGSHASQMAKMICLYSPWQFVFWYDRPQGSPSKRGGAGGAEGFIPEIEDLQFYKQIPTVWDETKVIDGYPGQFAIVARRSGDTWFVGCLVGSEPKSIEISLNFLEQGTVYNAQVFSDDPTLHSLTNVMIEALEVNTETVYKREIIKMNGLAMIIKPNTKE